MRPTLLLLLALLSLPELSYAQSIAVSPVTVELAAGDLATTLNVTNRDTKPTTIQIRALAWDQKGGTDNMAATDNLMVSPPITEVAPGATQVVRLVLRAPAGASEAAYRVLLDQIPSTGTAGVVRVALRLSVPVFSEPAVQAVPMLDWSIADDGSGQLSLHVANTGLRHARVVSPAFSQEDGQKLQIQATGLPYVLAGATRRWPIVGHAAPGSTLHLSAKTESGSIDRMVRIGSLP